MFDAKFWQEIKEQHPKGYFQFLKKVCFFELKNINEVEISDNGRFCINIYNGENVEIKDICYCDIEKFFDEQGIIFVIDIVGNSWHIKDYVNNYDRFSQKIKDVSMTFYKSRNEAQLEAAKKAFEIMEGMK
ncbi:MAG: hypothetical protein WC389_03610 [Lutibacter sp.]|jgi:hypothetical protein